MTTAADILRVASSQIGYAESPANSNRTKYGQWYGLNGNPWCAMFASWVCHQAGYPLAIQTSKGFAWTPAGMAYFKKNNKWVTSGYRPGDMVFFNFDSDSGPEHVGFVEKVTSSGLVTIEGNTSASSNANGGQVQRRTRSYGRAILGAGRLSLTAAKPPAPTMTNDGYTHPVLTEGDSGRSVLHAQNLLHAKGLVIVLDGKFGTDTKRKVISFQKTRGLTPDGAIGKYTWTALHH